MNVWKYLFVLEGKITTTFAGLVVLQLCKATANDDLRDVEIHNGNDVKSNEFPWMLWIKRNRHFMCGGALLSKFYAITAAHCVKRPAKYQVVLSDYDRSVNDGSEVIINVVERHLHPDYRITSTEYPTWTHSVFENDIALLRLETPADLDRPNIGRIRRFSSIEIDQQITNNQSANCVVIGWGYKEYGSSWMLSPLLQELQIKIMNDTRCSEIMLDSYDPATRLCFENTDSGTCKGDNGGPWVCRVNNRWTLVGINSYSILHDGCRGGGGAGTRISHYVEWMNSNTKRRSRNRLRNRENLDDIPS